jgi:phage shock protein A
VATRPNFTVTRRSLPGLYQLPSYADIAQTGSPAAPRTPGTQGAPIAPTAQRPEAGLTSLGETRGGYADLLRENDRLREGYMNPEFTERNVDWPTGTGAMLAGGYAPPPTFDSLVQQPTSQWGQLASGVSDFYRDENTFGLVSDTRPGAQRAVDTSLLINQTLRDEDARKRAQWGNTSIVGSTSPDGDPDGSFQANETRRMKDMFAEVMKGSEVTSAMSEDDYRGILNGIDSTFQGLIIDWTTDREQALADGKQEVADSFAQKISDLERQKADIQAEAANFSSVEAWFRERIKQPYEDAKMAAMMVDIAPIIAKQAEAETRVQGVISESDARMSKVLTDLGVDPSALDNAMAADVADAEVMNAEIGLLSSIGVRPEMLEQRKQFEFHMLDAERLSQARQSAGEEMVVNEKARKAVAEADRQLGEIDGLKARALARVERAIERSYGDGPEFPSRDEYAAAAMDAVTTSLMGDLPTAQQDAFKQLAMDMINGGITDITGDGFFQFFKSNQDLWSDEAMGIIESAAEGIYNGFNLPDGLTQAQQQEAYNEAMRQATSNENLMRNALNATFDPEDTGILAALVDTYTSANDRWQTTNNAKATQAGQGGSGIYQNTNVNNIEEAKTGVGAYGKRAREVVKWASHFEDMFSGSLSSKGIQGQNYFRPLNVIPTSGSTNSDHFTGGALDVFFKDQRTYDTVGRPYLEQLQKQGLIRYTIHMGDNHAHGDHAHISFPLSGVNDGDMQIPAAGAK